MPYIHEDPDWPHFHWDMTRLGTLLAEVRYRQGLLLGKMSSIGFASQQESGLENLFSEALHSAGIEGERLPPQQVRSSIARQLGLDAAGLPPASRKVDGMVAMLIDATRRADDPLDPARLFRWHAGLFPSPGGLRQRMRLGAWRGPESGPMRVVSGPYGRETIHFEAPEAGRVPFEMSRFLQAFNEDAGEDPLLKAGVAHFHFITIHPFEDGNGRIARAITDLALARADRVRERFYSMSARIEAERDDYYDILERSQTGGADITDWLFWFLSCLGRSFDVAERQWNKTFRRARFWENANRFSPNERQRQVLTLLWEGFEGHLTSGQYAKIAKCSPDSALRDLQNFVAHGLLRKAPEGGRSTHYLLVDESGE